MHGECHATFLPMQVCFLLQWQWLILRCNEMSAFKTCFDNTIYTKKKRQVLKTYFWASEVLSLIKRQRSDFWSNWTWAWNAIRQLISDAGMGRRASKREKMDRAQRFDPSRATCTLLMNKLRHFSINYKPSQPAQSSERRAPIKCRGGQPNQNEFACAGD